MDEDEPAKIPHTSRERTPSTSTHGNANAPTSLPTGNMASNMTPSHPTRSESTASTTRPNQPFGNDAPSTTTIGRDKDGPPSLNYTIRTRTRLIWITAFWSLTLLDSCIAPIALYFSLRYTTDLPLNTVFSIVTGAIGGLSIFEYALRSRRLWKKNSTCRPVGAGRWVFDFFHWVYTLAWLICMVELVVGSVPDDPYIRLIAMTPSTFLWVFGLQLCVFDLMGRFGIRSPVRLSSQPRGSVPLNGVMVIVEDVVAVDGNGGTEYRERLRARYEQSKVFRSLMDTMTFSWGYGATGMAVVVNALVFTLDEDYAYVVGWAVPFIWAGIWAGASRWYVERMLRIERETWRPGKV